jgi:hypothetical protein
VGGDLTPRAGRPIEEFPRIGRGRDERPVSCCPNDVGRSARTLALLLAAGVIFIAGDAASRSYPFAIVVHANQPVRVQIALSPQGTLPCDSSDNEMLFDGMVDPRKGLVVNAEWGPVCVRHAFDNDPDGNLGRSELWYRRSQIVLCAHVGPDWR